MPQTPELLAEGSQAYRKKRALLNREGQRQEVSANKSMQVRLQGNADAGNPGRCIRKRCSSCTASNLRNGCSATSLCSGEVLL